MLVFVAAITYLEPVDNSQKATVNSPWLIDYVDASFVAYDDGQRRPQRGNQESQSRWVHTYSIIFCSLIKSWQENRNSKTSRVSMISWFAGWKINVCMSHCLKGNMSITTQTRRSNAHRFQILPYRIFHEPAVVPVCNPSLP